MPLLYVYWNLDAKVTQAKNGPYPLIWGKKMKQILKRNWLHQFDPLSPVKPRGRNPSVLGSSVDRLP